MEKRFVEKFLNNGRQHIVYTKFKRFDCPACGHRWHKEKFFTINATIVEVSETNTIVEDLEGRIIALTTDDIRMIEWYNPEIDPERKNKW